MSEAIQNIQRAIARAMAIRPKSGGFPYLAEALRMAGVSRNIWHLPSCQSLYITELGSVMVQGTPMISGMSDVPTFDKEAFIKALRREQAGDCSFPEFLEASWRAGIVRYDIDFSARTVTYYACRDERYVEAYPIVQIN